MVEWLYCLPPLHSPCSWYSIFHVGWWTSSVHVSLGKLIKIFSPQVPTPEFWFSKYEEPRNLHFNYSALRHKDVYSTLLLLASEYWDPAFFMMPWSLREGIDYMHPLWHIQPSIWVLSLVPTQVNVLLSLFSHTRIIPGWLLVGERNIQGR